MNRTTLIQPVLLAIAIISCGALVPTAQREAGAQQACRHCGKANCVTCRERDYGNPDLFYNFYVPGNCGGVGAQMYVAPYPVPQTVGHTYYTYQPMMPHELLYAHSHRYYNYYNGGRGLNRTHVMYYSPPVRSTLHGIRKHFTLAR